MLFQAQADEFNDDTAALLEAVCQSAPSIPAVPEAGPRLIVGYLAGILTPHESAIVETRAIEEVETRRRLTGSLPMLDGLRSTPYSELVSSPLEQGSPESETRREWLRIVDQHIQLVTRHLRSTPPTRWPALVAMWKEGPTGRNAAKTIWRALFGQGGQTTVADGLLRLGFGYRRGAVRGDTQGFQIRGADMEDRVSGLHGEVLPNGDVEVIATIRPGSQATSLFLSYGVGGRALALAEADIVDGVARVVVESLGLFLKLNVGPLSSGSLVARSGGWPESCDVANIAIDSGQGKPPILGLPEVRGGFLELQGYFEEGEPGANWELSVAVSPTSWQVLGRFAITGVIERPQVLKAALPKTAMEGPFGGALLLKRLGPVGH